MKYITDCRKTMPVYIAVRFQKDHRKHVMIPYPIGFEQREVDEYVTEKVLLVVNIPACNQSAY